MRAESRPENCVAGFGGKGSLTMDDDRLKHWRR